MKRNRHHFLITFLILVMSVFFFSCGIPSYVSLNNISLSRNTSKLGFNVSGQDTDLSIVEKGPGVLIMYVVGESSSPYSDLTNSTGLIKEFSNLTSTKLYINSDNSVLNYTSSNSNDYVLMAFENVLNNNSEHASSPSYNIDLKSNSYISNNRISDKAKFLIEEESWIDNKLIFNVKDANNKIIQQISANITNNPNTYVYIYAAFSAEVGEFSNNYWSTLKYIGTFSYSE